MIKAQINSMAVVTSKGPHRLAEVVASYLCKEKKVTRTDDSATSEQLDWTEKALQQAQYENTEINPFNALRSLTGTATETV